MSGNSKAQLVPRLLVTSITISITIRKYQYLSRTFTITKFLRPFLNFPRFFSVLRDSVLALNQWTAHIRQQFLLQASLTGAV